MSSYVSLGHHTGRYNSYCVEEINRTNDETKFIDVNLFFKFLFFLFQQKETNINDKKICENYTINHSKNVKFSCKSSIDKCIQSKNKILVIDNFLESEEQFALLYSIILDIYDRKIFFDNKTYSIFLFKFKNKEQNRFWLNYNLKYKHKKVITEFVNLQMKCFDYSINEENPGNEGCNKYQKTEFRTVFYVENEKLLRSYLFIALRKKTEPSYFDHLYIRYKILLYENIKFKKPSVLFSHKNFYKEYRNRMVIITLNIKFEMEFCTSLYILKKVENSNNKLLLNASVSVYRIYGLNKKLFFRFQYEFTYHEDEYILVHNNGKNYNNFIINDNIERFNRLYNALYNLTNQNCLFHNCNNILFKYFVANYYYLPFNQYAYQVFYDNKVSCLFQSCNNLIKYKLQKNFSDVKIEIYHMTFGTNEHTYEQKENKFSIYNTMHVLNDIDENDLNKHLFYSCKTIAIAFKFTYKGEKKQFSYIVPIKDRKLVALICSPVDHAIYKSIETFYQKYISINSNEHYSYLNAIFKFIIIEAKIFEPTKLTILGIYKLKINIDYINFIMIRYVERSSYLKNYIKLTLYDEQDKEWFYSAESYKKLLKSSTYKILLCLYEQNKVFIQLRRIFIKLFVLCYKLFCRKLNCDNMKEQTCFFLLDQNETYDAKLNDLVCNQLSEKE
ncbi:hypothetical protein COBT_001705 [Conglomerata obtusa]